MSTIKPAPLMDKLIDVDKAFGRGHELYVTVFRSKDVAAAVAWFCKRIEDHRPDFKWTKAEILAIKEAAFPDVSEVKE